MAVFNYSGRNFLLNGKPIRIISGSMHYFRIHPRYWEDRMRKLKALGCNTLETYIAWKLHEREEGLFCFDGALDFVRYIRLAQSLGLLVIVRPGPYICSEMDFGGMPGWILKDKNMHLRCSDEFFLKHVRRYFNSILPLLCPLQCIYGGPVIAMQIENEYGAYGNDREYLNTLKTMMINKGINILLFTSDNPVHYMLQGGMLPDVLETLNFGSNPEERFAILENYQPGKPLMCMEFWVGWFDYWGGKHNTGSAPDLVAQTLEHILKIGASVNFYMFHGGTNFGFTNGANKSATSFEPDVTSYDYGSLLDEAGDPTEKYYLCRDVIAKYVDGLDTSARFSPSHKASYRKVKLTHSAGYWESLGRLSSPIDSIAPLPMEMLGQDMGFVHYHTHLSGPRDKTLLTLQDLHDRAIVFLDKIPICTMQYGRLAETEITVSVEGTDLDILVENMGRVNYGPLMKDYKGITDGVRFSNQFLFGWKIFPMPLNDLHSLRWACISPSSFPAFLQGSFTVDKPEDTYLLMKGFVKGCVYINGSNIGRYWEIGPQQTLFVPGPLLHTGQNDLVIFELHGMARPEVDFIDHPILDL